MNIAAILTLAMLLDGALGEPRVLWTRLPHPAVLIGRAVAALDRRLNTRRGRRAKGAAALAILCLGAWAAGAAIAQLGGLITAVAAGILIAQRSLVDHVAGVAAALRQSTPAGRAAVAMIVGRDVSAMEGPDITRAAIESAAENFSDGVIAPLFWLCVGGLPGLAIYKAVNTADSMIGHRTPRHLEFGWAAARLDDVLNIVPARLSAALIAVLAQPRPRWRDIAGEARRHRSPNGGWPEAAMARSIGVALSGPRAYHGQMQDYPFVNPDGLRESGPAQIDAAVRVLWRAWAAVLACASVASLLM